MPERLTSDMAGWFLKTASPADVYRIQLCEKLRKIEALFAGGRSGRRAAHGGEAALERVRERLTELGWQNPSIEMQFSMPDQWSRHCFLPCAGVMA